ncbi:acyltransferase [Carnobacterium sp. TMP28]|uniref:acyltransferase n=1 Tax=Carnobacterium sp. TMP28 TaxID=3397060 RepID=UPI0039E01F22
MQKEREIGIDIIKCIAIFSVIGVHFILNTLSSINIKSSFDIMVLLSYRQFFIICVPLFLLTTGYLNIKKEPSIKYFKKIFFIVGVYLFYSILTLFFRNTFMNESFSLSDGVRMIFSFEAIPYAWYINMFIKLSLIVPFLNRLIKVSSKKKLDWFLLFLIGVSVIPSTWNNFSSFFGYANVLRLPNFLNDLYPIAYYVIGGYIKLYLPVLEKKYYLLIGLAMYIFSIYVNFSYSSIGNISNAIKDYSSLFILIQAYCVFMYLLDKKIKKLKSLNPLIIRIASHTLDIYLISYIVDNIVYKVFRRFFFSNTVADYLYALLIVTIIFASSIMIVFFLNGLNKEIKKFLNVKSIFRITNRSKK